MKNLTENEFEKLSSDELKLAIWYIAALMQEYNTDDTTSEPVDPYAELKQAVKDGKQIQIKYFNDDHWYNSTDATQLGWNLPTSYYRIVEDDPVDPYAELKQAVKDGKQIQKKDIIDDNWYTERYPTLLRWSFTPDRYRIVEDDPVDPYAELKQAVKDGKQIQINDIVNDNWYTTPHPTRLNWIYPPNRYRIAEDEPFDQYAELKQAAKDGKQIQVNDINGRWHTTQYPKRLSWNLTPSRYRIVKELDWDMIPAGTLFDLELHNGNSIKDASFYKNTGDIQFSTIDYTYEWSDIKSVKLAKQEFKAWLGADHDDLWDIPGVLVQVVFRGDTEIDYDATTTNGVNDRIYKVKTLDWSWHGGTASYDIIAYRIVGLQDGYTEKYF